MSRRLEDELAEFDCGLDPSAFRELLETRKHQMAPSYTVDELVCRPDDAKAYCNSIRSEAGCSRVPDFVILKALMNIRRSH